MAFMQSRKALRMIEASMGATVPSVARVDGVGAGRAGASGSGVGAGAEKKD